MKWAVLRWRIEKYGWLLAIPVLKFAHLLGSTQVISALSVYALFQVASTRLEQLESKQREEDG